MRARHVLAVLSVLVIGLALKQFLMPPIQTEAEIPRLGMDVLQMHVKYPDVHQMKVDQMHDMQTVFTQDD